MFKGSLLYSTDLLSLHWTPTEEPCFVFIALSLQVLIYVAKISLSLLQAEQAQLSQSLLTVEVLQSHHLDGPPLDYLLVFLVLEGPKKDSRCSLHTLHARVQVLTVTEGNIYHYGPCIFDASKWSLEHICMGV